MSSQMAAYQFVFKWEFETNPFRIIIIMFLYCCLTLGFLFRCNEHQTSIKIAEQQEFTYYNSIWICFITMSSVGYGEISPISLPGKLISVLWSFAGVLVQAATVISTLKVLRFDNPETLSLYLLDLVDLKQQIKINALYILQLRYKLK